MDICIGLKDMSLLKELEEGDKITIDLSGGKFEVIDFQTSFTNELIIIIKAKEKR